MSCGLIHCRGNPGWDASSERSEESIEDGRSCDQVHCCGRVQSNIGLTWNWDASSSQGLYIRIEQYLTLMSGLEDKVAQLTLDINALHDAVVKVNWSELNRSGFVAELSQSASKLRSIYASFEEVDNELKFALEKNSSGSQQDLSREPEPVGGRLRPGRFRMG